MPEHFSIGYDDFIRDVATAHPQMMELFTKLFGDRFILDHCNMLNRTPGSIGRRWHAHQYRQGQYEVEDPIGTGHALTTEFLQRLCIRTLCYPEGATIEEGGDLGSSPGAHLYRIPYKWNTERPDDDAAMKAGWLKGKIHAFTRKPFGNGTLLATAREHGLVSPSHAASCRPSQARNPDPMWLADSVSDTRPRRKPGQVDKWHTCPLGGNGPRRKEGSPLRHAECLRRTIPSTDWTFQLDKIRLQPKRYEQVKTVRYLLKPHEQICWRIIAGSSHWARLCRRGMYDCALQ